MLKSVVKRILPPAFADHLAVYYQSRPQKTPVIVFQMGKVGSKTILASLENANLPYSIYHVHFLSQEGMRFAQDFFDQHHVQTPRHLLLSRRLSQRIATDHSQTTWQVITGTREPIQRHISDFFENVEYYWPELITAQGMVDADQALYKIHDQLLMFSEQTDYACTWFSREIKPVFGIDIYSTPYNIEQGYTILHQGNVNLLVIRLEDLNRSFTPAIKEFFHLENDIPMVKANIGAEKKYHQAYQYVVQNIRIPRAVCETIYASRYARHFYTPEERQRLIARWSEA